MERNKETFLQKLLFDSKEDQKNFYKKVRFKEVESMRIFLFASIVPLLVGCMGNDGLRSSAVADANVINLSKISLGMKQDEVLSVMKEPYSEEKIALDGSQFEVWFYITSPTVLGQTKMVAANLTPLTFKNGELIGWGSSYYHYLMKRKKAELKVEATKVGTKTAPSKDMPNQGGQVPPPSGPKKPNWGPVSPQNPSPKPPEEAPAKSSQQNSSHPSKEEGNQQPNQKTPSSGQNDQNKPKATSSLDQPQEVLISEAKESSSEESNVEKEKEKKESSSKKEKKPPLDKEDDDLLDEASDQEFNQT